MNDGCSASDSAASEASRGQDSAEQLKLYRLLVENSLGLMCIHDLDGVLRFINRWGIIRRTGTSRRTALDEI
jgi:hypothetical protein